MLIRPVSLSYPYYLARRQENETLWLPISRETPAEHVSAVAPIPLPYGEYLLTRYAAMCVLEVPAVPAELGSAPFIPFLCTAVGNYHIAMSQPTVLIHCKGPVSHGSISKMGQWDELASSLFIMLILSDLTMKTASPGLERSTSRMRVAASLNPVTPPKKGKPL